MSKVTIDTHPRLRLAGLRHVGPYPSMGRTFEKLGPLAGQQGLWGPDSLVVAVTYDDPKLVPEAELRTDCCLIIADDVAVAQPLTEITIRAGLRARWRHVGPYSGLQLAWPAFIKELTAMAPAELPEPSDLPCFEIYLNDPADTAPAELITDLYIPLD
jgi:AraC family transcriptional regulator